MRHSIPLPARRRKPSRANQHDRRYDGRVEPDRFDDVSYEILEEPEPRRPARTRGRRAVAVTGLTLAVGALAAAAALAVTTPGSTPPAKPSAPPAAEYNPDGMPIFNHGGGCRHRKGAADKYPARGFHHDRGSLTAKY